MYARMFVYLIHTYVYMYVCIYMSIMNFYRYCIYMYLCMYINVDSGVFFK